MITFICGKPGGGKSLTALREMAIALDDSNGPYIVTNLSLRLDSIMERWGIETALSRIRILDDSEIGEFYLCRRGEQGDFDLPLHVPAGLGYEVPDLGSEQLDPVVDRGTLYIIDEVHVHFHARQWQRVGMATQFWATQHRKINDRVLLLTQKIEQVEKQLRNLGQEYWLCENLQKKAGPVKWVKHSSKIKVHRYLSPNPQAEKQADSFEFAMDPSLFELYDTSGGVGVRARGIKEKDGAKKGMNVKLFLVLALVGIVLGGWAVMKGSRVAVTKGLESSGSMKAVQEIEKTSTQKEDKPAGNGLFGGGGSADEFPRMLTPSEFRRAEEAIKQRGELAKLQRRYEVALEERKEKANETETGN